MAFFVKKRKKFFNLVTLAKLWLVVILGCYWEFTVMEFTALWMFVLKLATLGKCCYLQ